MEFKTAMTFNSHKKDRSFFLHVMIKFLWDKVTHDHRELISLIIEILKNIYDHTDGYGQIYINKTKNFIEFEIKDFGTKSFDIEKLSKIEFTTKETSFNKGSGLHMMILDKRIHKTLGLKLDLDVSCGFKYFGKYDIHILGRE